ncbi:endonuclease VII domain-containing protein [Catenuloplanes indicus]|uniref:endonuclease VII domain-containing protein n=1 Tax=Catenuloplanes indicus TaxID=137267 RepID=UPI0027D82003|nr:endonuclease VII domain-containing protein [Catenuloplanes indicus]
MDSSSAVKICMTCKKSKGLSSFGRDRHQPDGKDRRCRDCARRQRRPYDPVREAARKYGISVARYNEALAEQNGACAICRRPPARGVLVVDHCHESGLFRGLICGTHNIGIGLLGDSLTTLLKARRYLEGGGREE